jgi:hypothetical protein
MDTVDFIIIMVIVYGILAGGFAVLAYLAEQFPYE